MTLRIELAASEQAHLVHQAMRDAHKEYIFQRHFIRGLVSGALKAHT
jgi:hypothetical protein